MRQSLIDHLMLMVSADRGGTGFAELDQIEAEWVVDALVEWLKDNDGEIAGTSIVDLAGILDTESR